ncbi:ABC transporter permease protein MalFG family protein [Halorhabdus tiamatea SARL4B]|uniref:ABC transporter permease protein MalFG family protein n=1 Tax=Halorhabdus tiamatea SARL4B TaxID=1033806 RepID=F7PJ81_9EURY|nr:carbohydrate ABC transporter permease [Halorhabdus tiamatea]ERJ06811.1 ABC transporter permease protein MalFG family protein [Halorhabdus tiamatea SARL4B]CCQ33050.1 maltose/maltodextrin ABC transporter, permease protein MalG [Halorhabdus tiamatea SARL4B]
MSVTPQSDSETTESGGGIANYVRRVIHDEDVRERFYRALFYVAAAFFLITTLFPFYWLFVLALTPNSEILAGDWSLPVIGIDFPHPKGFNIGAFVEVFQQIPFHLYVFNSFVLATVTTIFVLIIASLAGYVFGRLEFPGRGALMLIVLAISYFPPAAFLIPLFDAFLGNAIVVPFLGIELFSIPRIVNTPWAMITPFSALFLPLSIFILTTFYGQIPDGLEDAARVEGTTRLGALVRVIMPLSAPGLATAAVLTFISVYNEYFFSSLMALENTPGNWSPLVGGILSYQTQYTTSFNLMAAASIVGVLPVVLLVIVAQERIVSGLTQGALKE